MNRIFSILVLCVLGYVSHAQVIDSSTMKVEMKQARQYYLEGKKSSWEKSFPIYLKWAQRGNIQAMNSLALQYQHGAGVDTNYVEALHWFRRAQSQGSPIAYYYLGRTFKYGYGVPVDYKIAYDYFSNGALLGDINCLYFKGYCLYKGLGCQQNYAFAVSLFQKSAQKGYTPAMYFLGLCYRNGYGITQNDTAAQYWLLKASSKGYSYATVELKSQTPENNPNAIDMVNRISTVEKISPKQSPEINTYSKIETSLNSGKIEGIYEGYLVKYDYSGQHIVDVSNLSLQLACTDGTLSGNWIELDTVPIHAYLTKEGIIFNGMEYRKTEHYFRSEAQLYSFVSATLQISNYGDSVFLSGELKLFWNEEKEPEKPIRVVLVRKSKGNSSSTIEFVNTDGSKILEKTSIAAYPNPFTDLLNIEFTLNEKVNVATQILTIDGKIVSETSQQAMEPGRFLLPLKVNLKSGVYVVRLLCGNQVNAIKVIRQ